MFCNKIKFSISLCFNITGSLWRIFVVLLKFEESFFFKIYFCVRWRCHRMDFWKFFFLRYLFPSLFLWCRQYLHGLITRTDHCVTLKILFYLATKKQLNRFYLGWSVIFVIVKGRNIIFGLVPTKTQVWNNFEAFQVTFLPLCVRCLFKFQTK